MDVPEVPAFALPAVPPVEIAVAPPEADVPAPPVPVSMSGAFPQGPEQKASCVERGDQMMARHDNHYGSFREAAHGEPANADNGCWPNPVEKISNRFDAHKRASPRPRRSRSHCYFVSMLANRHIFAASTHQRRWGSELPLRDCVLGSLHRAPLDDLAGWLGLEHRRLLGEGVDALALFGRRLLHHDQCE